MSERDERYWGPYPGEVPLSRTSRPRPEPRPVPTPLVRAETVAPPEAPEPVAPPEAPPEPEPVTRSETVDPPEVAPEPDVPAPVADRAPSRAERRRDGNAMVPLLAQALTTQLAKLGADVDPVPDGWWFTPQR